LAPNCSLKASARLPPYLYPKGSGPLIDFLQRAFGAVEVQRYDSPEGTLLHAKIRIGDTIIAMAEAHGQWQPMPSMIYMHALNVEAAYERAIQADPVSVSAPANQPYGDRIASIEDPAGNQWYSATHFGGGQ
jgi:PhnB protein